MNGRWDWKNLHKKDGDPYEINISNYDRTIGEQVFNNFNLHKELLKFYSIAFIS